MRMIREQWTEIGFAVEQGQQQRVSPEGFPMMTPGGEPDMEPITTLIFVHETEEMRWRVQVPFNEVGRKKLIDALLGSSIVVPGADDLPEGLKLQ